MSRPEAAVTEQATRREEGNSELIQVYGAHMSVIEHPFSDRLRRPATAGIHADPRLARRLRRPFTAVGVPVERPSG
jgi:hypothetical protein